MERKNTNKKITLAILVMTVMFSSFALVSADFWQCFGDGDFINFCNSAIPDRTCDSDSCRFCMDSFNEAQNCYSPGAFNACNDGGAPQGCANLGGGEIDGEAPNITITSPVQNELYPNRNVLVSISATERVDIYYLDLIEGRNRWTRLCSGCSNENRARSFQEGINQIRFRATDRAGNEVFQDVTFFVDSKEPKIRDSMPDGDFANGDFSVEYTEGTVDEVTLHYGNSVTGMRNKVLTNCPSGENVVCETNVNLADYDGEEIIYYFTVSDLAGNEDMSREEELGVDISAPVINSLDFTKDEDEVSFVIDITESNLEAVEYKDLTDPKARWKKLCSRLENGVCEKDARFDDGNRQVAIQVRDEAGFTVSQQINFFIDSESPDIKDTEPSRDFANGDFLVEFDEANPVSVILNYGNPSTGMRNKVLNINNDCFIDRYYVCETNVNLADYDGEEIIYYFTVSDLAGNEDMSREEELDVDISFPVINNVDFSVERNRVEFILDITESNLDVVEYKDNSDSRARWRRMCTRLDEGICEKGITLRESGVHNIEIQVIDDAGNVVSQSVDVTI